MVERFVFIVFYFCIVHASYGLIVDENSGSVASTNPTLAEEQAFIKLFGSKDPDEAATCGQLIESRGFEYEVHYVTTEDGYILQNFRIINRYARESRKNLKPVLLLHALFTSCSAWMFNSPGGHIKPWINGHSPNDTSAELAFLLANLGFDVWLINVRGTSYSTNHTHLDPEDPQFWDYSFYEIGIYDVTATVEYIKKETGFETIIVVGFSQGTIQLLIQMSAIPGYDKNYDLVILLEPIGFLGDKSGTVGAIPIPLFKQYFSSHNGPFPPMSELAFAALDVLCEKPILTPICTSLLGGIFGFDSQQLNASRIYVYAGLLDRTSNKNLLHFLQFIESDHLRYFDYGEDKNYELYGSAEPPEFPFHKINPKKLVFISGLNDQLATPINVQNLRNSLCDRVDTDHVITDPYFNHGDIVIAKDAFPYVNDVVSRLIEEKMLHDELLQLVLIKMNYWIHSAVVLLAIQLVLLTNSTLVKLIGRETALEAQPENQVFARQQLLLEPFEQSGDVALTCGQFIASRGFDYEVHFVTTEDGYILKNYRLWSKYAKQALNGRLKPILLIHGLFYSASIWLMNSPDGNILPWNSTSPPDDRSNSLAFHLANKGYDVWLLNNRGTSYSRNHTEYDTRSDSKFWDFSFYEMGIYDLPATTEYIKKVTGYEKIVLLGYSRGTLQTFIKLSLDPSYSQNYDLVIMAAPIAYLGNTKGLVTLFPREAIFYRPLHILNRLSLPPRLATFDSILTVLCSSPSNYHLCSNLMGLALGPDDGQLNYTRIPVYLSQIDKTSIKDLLHFLQTMNYDQARLYDYGMVENLVRYGKREPPRIPFENIPTDNLVLISGLNDYLSTPVGIEKLRHKLKGKPLVDHVITFPSWNHLDFTTAVDCYKYFVSVVDDILNTHLPLKV
ncbi:uncharacterized protein LOC107370456 [Tetranychus urticae]|uniref:uncharacterized protein LOC107370456 n=1 Tax=Tetranychus urticae TaxID=32264 RepID=UPI000D645D95|nr:uncharacterized protein LOC107370456 [Tetranychus urticae]